MCGEGRDRDGPLSVDFFLKPGQKKGNCSEVEKELIELLLDYLLDLS